MNKFSKIFIAGHNGMVGKAIVNLLKKKKFRNIILKKKYDLDLTNSVLVKKFFQKYKPEYVFHAAGLVGGIKANSEKKADFMYVNLAIGTNLIKYSSEYKVKKFLNLGSSCIYPRNAAQPINENSLMTGQLEPTNEGYSLAKLSTIKLGNFYREQYKLNFITIMPPNLYGPNDSFDLNNCHVLSALIKKFYDANKNKKKMVEIWGTGKATREFMHVNDLAEACLYFMKNYNDKEIINVGFGKDISIKQLAHLIKNSINYRGKIVWDKTKPDGMPKKCMNINKMKKLNFFPKISLKEGILEMIDIYESS
jgi:GDP-L-fucose synthase